MARQRSNYSAVWQMRDNVHRRAVAVRKCDNCGDTFTGVPIRIVESWLNVVKVDPTAPDCESNFKAVCTHCHSKFHPLHEDCPICDAYFGRPIRAR